ncbi:MAG: hypothetical protein JJ867_08835 [Marinobacter sp.]|nr:hypothetical protein [Marinobacter sp.]
MDIQQDKYDKIVVSLAKEILSIDSLEVRNSDSLDFYELSVWSIKEALIRAVKEGEELGKQQARG